MNPAEYVGSDADGGEEAEADDDAEAEAPPPAPEPVAAGSIQASTAATRLFRTITDWASSPSSNGEHRSDQGS
jgi:hypothetical protein